MPSKRLFWLPLRVDCVGGGDNAADELACCIIPKLVAGLPAIPPDK